jgi:DNA-binding transcriptional ArsR family regulator
MPKRQKRKVFLLHPTRREIYKAICELPGIYFYNLINELADSERASLSFGTLSHHLRKLEESGLIASTKIDGKRVYYPKRLRDPEIERTFTLLRNENARKIFLYIVNNENCYQNEIARALGLHHDTVSYHAEKLAEEFLIEKEKDSKVVKFTVGERGKQLLQGSLNLITAQYVHFLETKIKEGCLTPQVIEQTPTSVTIRISCPREDDIEFSINLKDWIFSEEEVADDDIYGTPPKTANPVA